MSPGRILLAAMTIAIMLATPAHAQFSLWPKPLPPAPVWGDYDEGHAWHDAAGGFNNRPDWALQHHAEWWGDYDNYRIWRPAAWWWKSDPAWTRAHHPEWW